MCNIQALITSHFSCPFSPSGVPLGCQNPFLCFEREFVEKEYFKEEFPRKGDHVYA
jgi:hypothetical protein